MADREGGPPAGVAERLERLRAFYVPETDAEARLRLQSEARVSSEPFAATVARRLEELRALCDLAACLHRGRQ